MGESMTKEILASRIDHTILKPGASEEQIRALCAEAARYGFASVCVNGKHAALASSCLRGQKPLVCVVVGFPLGAMEGAAKAEEAALAVKRGAREIDMVMDIGAAKEGNWKAVEDDIRGVVKASKRAAGRSAKVAVKVIIECCYLSDAEKERACAACLAGGADFVKTSTGFGPSGATIEDVKLLRREAGSSLRVKAAGGIRTTREAVAMIEAGADRIGASNGVEIVSHLEGA
jgi:deoxyribose-phosphate aldolase